MTFLKWDFLHKKVHDMKHVLLEKTVYQVRKALRQKHTLSTRSIGLPETFWAPGQTLGVSFRGAPEESLKQAIMNAAAQWLDHANLTFELREDNDSSAEIYIETDAPETLNQSDYGKYRPDPDGETMTLGIKPGHPRFELTVLHEFGHALGLYHEHQHPEANIPWDLDAVREYVAAKFTQEEREDPAFAETLERLIRQNYLPITYETITTLRYDKQSIMHYAIDQSLTLTDWSSDWNFQLSDKDKQFISMIYPIPE